MHSHGQPADIFSLENGGMEVTRASARGCIWTECLVAESGRLSIVEIMMQVRAAGRREVSLVDGTCQ